MSMYEAFVYEWTNTLNNMKYIGSHKGFIDDGYVSSSKLFLEDYNKNPNIFVRKIVAQGNLEEMRELESCLLIEVDAAKNPLYYNQHNQNGKFICSGHTEETRNKMKKKIPWNKGKKNIYSKETIEKMRLKKKDYVPWNVGISPSEETRKKLARPGPKNHYYGKKRPDHAEKMREIWKKKREQCLHQ